MKRLFLFLSVFFGALALLSGEQSDSKILLGFLQKALMFLVTYYAILFIFFG